MGSNKLNKINMKLIDFGLRAYASTWNLIFFVQKICDASEVLHLTFLWKIVMKISWIFSRFLDKISWIFKEISWILDKSHGFLQKKHCFRAKTGLFRSNLMVFGPNTVKYGRFVDISGQIWADSSRLWPGRSRIWPFDARSNRLANLWFVSALAFRRVMIDPIQKRKSGWTIRRVLMIWAAADLAKGQVQRIPKRIETPRTYVAPERPGEFLLMGLDFKNK